jgi:hypothetical protein
MTNLLIEVILFLAGTLPIGILAGSILARGLGGDE